MSDQINTYDCTLACGCSIPVKAPRTERLLGQVKVCPTHGEAAVTQVMFDSPMLHNQAVLRAIFGNPRD